jgi:hypothetical protein
MFVFGSVEADGLFTPNDVHVIEHLGMGGDKPFFSFLVVLFVAKPRFCTHTQVFDPL